MTQILLTAVIDGKDWWYRVNVKKLDEFFNKDVLGKVFEMIKTKKLIEA